MPTFTKTSDIAGDIVVSETFTAGDTVTISVIDLLTGTPLLLESSVCVDTAGVFSWDFYNLPNNIITPSAYIYIMTNQSGIKISNNVKIYPVGGAVTPVYSTLTVQLYEYDAALSANTTTVIASGYIHVYDSTGQTLITQTQASTLGLATFSLVDGDYVIKASKAGVSFISEAITINNTSNSTPTQIVYGTLLGVPALTTTPNTCRVYEYCFDVDSTTILPSVSSSATIVDQNTNYYGRTHSVSSEIGVYDSATGELYWDIVWGATVQFSISEVGISKKVVIPELLTQRLTDITVA